MKRRETLSVVSFGALLATAKTASAQSSAASLVINVKDYGATGNGVTDDTASIVSALAALPSTGGTIAFPAGKYRVTQSINIPIANVTVCGTGRASSVISVDGSFDVFSVTQNSCEIKDLFIYQVNSNSTATAIHVTNCGGHRFDNLILVVHNGIIFNGGSESFISNIYAPQISGGLIALGGTQAAPVADIFIDTIDAGAVGTAATGIALINFCSGIYVSKANLMQFVYGMLTTSQIGVNYPFYVFCSQVIADTSLGNAYEIESGSTMRFSQCWGASSAGRGFNITGGSNIWLDGCTVVRNQDQGVYVQTSGGVHIRNSQIAINSQTQQGAFNGVHVPPGVSGVTVEGCRLGTLDPGQEKQAYGAYFDSGSNNYIVTGNDARGNILGGIYNGGTTSVVASNLP